MLDFGWAASDPISEPQLPRAMCPLKAYIQDVSQGKFWKALQFASTKGFLKACFTPVTDGPMEKKRPRSLPGRKWRGQIPP